MSCLSEPCPSIGMTRGSSCWYMRPIHAADFQSGSDQLGIEQRFFFQEAESLGLLERGQLRLAVAQFHAEKRHHRRHQRQFRGVVKSQPALAGGVRYVL